MTAAMMTDELPKLLIVEDDPALARTLKRSFERRGYRACVATTPEGSMPCWPSAVTIMPWST